MHPEPAKAAIELRGGMVGNSGVGRGVEIEAVAEGVWIGGRKGPRCLVDGGGVGNGEPGSLRLELVFWLFDDWQQLRDGWTVIVGGSLPAVGAEVVSSCMRRDAAFASTSKPPCVSFVALFGVSADRHLQVQISLQLQGFRSL